MVIEFLTFTVAPADQAHWLDLDADTWTRFLQRQPGFVSKQVWVDREFVDQVHAVITWTDEASWHAIPSDELAAVDAEMGEWIRPCTLRAFDVGRTC